jgi:hypothetical protein
MNFYIIQSLPKTRKQKASGVGSMVLYRGVKSGSPDRFSGNIPVFILIK